MRLTPTLRLLPVLALGLVMATPIAPARADLFKDAGSALFRLFGGDPYRLLEKAIASEMPKQLAPAKRYEVRLSRRGSELERGLLSRIDVTGIDVKTEDGLVIPRMDLQLHDVRIDLGKRSLREVGSGLFSAFLDDGAVSRYVAKRSGIRDVHVGFRDGQVWVKGTPEV